MQVDLRVAQLLSSRLCHDLVGPIGAVNTGLELFQEGFDDDEKALGLVADSAGDGQPELAATCQLTVPNDLPALGGLGGVATAPDCRRQGKGRWRWRAVDRRRG